MAPPKTKKTKTLTKAEIVEAFVKAFRVRKLFAKELVDKTFEKVRERLERGEKVKISGLGNFELRDKKARPGRNPKTGENKIIKARRVVTFKGGQKLKAKINEKQRV